MKFMYDKENGAGPLAVIIFLVAFFLIGLAALFSFIITNKTYEYKINNKNYVVYGDVLKLEEMLLKDYIIGGEQSGHIIFKELATTGDGELTALQILNIINEENKSLKECSKIMKKYPQVSKNIKVKNEDKKELFTNDEINNIINKSKDILKDTGRIIVRPSGTEPLIRVMIEGNDLDLINQLLNDIAHVIENKIGIK